MAIHAKDRNATNPRLQCSVCGEWKRLHTKDAQPPHGLKQTFFGGCEFSGGGDHLAGDRVDICEKCCHVECRRIRAEAIAKAEAGA